MGQRHGVPPSGSGLRPSGGAAKASPAEPLVPNAGEYATFVFYHADETARRAFCSEMFDRFPFGGDTPTRLTAIATGDATGVSEAMRMALECEDIDRHEQKDLVLELAECTSWEDCLAKFTEWELEPKDGQLVDLRAASGIEAPSGVETAQTGSTEGESPARSEAEGDAHV